MHKKIVSIGAALVLTAAAVFAQSEESDFETKANGDGTLTITKYVGWDSKVSVPAAIGGRAVTAIGDRAFARQDNLTGVTLPDGVVSIGDEAFANNKLVSVTFGKGLEVIGRQAFANNNLASLTLPDTVRFIGARAFSRNALAKVTAPGSGTVIGDFAFGQNKQLTSVTLGSNFGFNLRAFSDTVFSNEEEEISYLSVVTDSDYNEFENANFGERGRNLLWDYVCNDRKAGAYTPDVKKRARKTDGEYEYIAGKNGAALVSYNGKATVLQIPEKVGGLAVKHLHHTLFNNDDGVRVERVRIPNSVTSIGDRTFAGERLTSIVIPDSVTYIGAKAFNDIPLTSLTLGKNVVIIGDEAFNGQRLASLVIPDSVTFIGSQAFYNGTITSLTLGKGLTYIGKSAFGNNNLTSVVIPDGVKYIGDSAFSGSADHEIASLTLGKGVTYIGERAFNGQKLTSVVIPDSVKVIGEYAFYGNSLTSLTLGTGLVFIGEYAFGSNKLTSVVIPDGVQAIGNGAFYSNNNLTSVTIGGGVALERDADAIPCADAYIKNGKKAGVYTRPDTKSDWTYTEG